MTEYTYNIYDKKGEVIMQVDCEAEGRRIKTMLCKDFTQDKEYKYTLGGNEMTREVSYLKTIKIGDVVQLNEKTTSPGTLGIVEEVKNGLYTVLIPLPDLKTTWYGLAKEHLEYIGVAAFIRKK